MNLVEPNFSDGSQIPLVVPKEISEEVLAVVRLEHIGLRWSHSHFRSAGVSCGNQRTQAISNQRLAGTRPTAYLVYSSLFYLLQNTKADTSLHVPYVLGMISSIMILDTEFQPV